MHTVSEKESHIMSRKIKRLTTRSQATAIAIRDREPFTTSGSLKGEVVSGLTSWDSGRLSGPDLDRFHEDKSRIEYVVFSFATPIAWITEEGEWYIVRAKFSPTTSKHQGNLYLINQPKAGAR